MPVEQADILAWIGRYLMPAGTILPGTSYSLKHVCEMTLKGYVSNDAMKAAMIAAGFQPTMKSANEINHRYYAKYTAYAMDCFANDWSVAIHTGLPQFGNPGLHREYKAKRDRQRALAARW